ncbi:helix-turn-helix domain-containing protein [Microbacterium phyllosphaerae]|uniref:helix-turn-helix domain-containing protein n=1 Tax=Microbacterium phyllosphaerae TaxID=124798 RepID=UPI00142E42AC|nr:helix-turn-helix transcriptional regulator [Microbacterium phyllosphaerae]
MPSRVLEALAEGLRKFRAERGLSQEEMAHRIGCSIPTYRSLEKKGGVKIADPKLSTIMGALKMIGLDSRLIEALHVVCASEHDEGLPSIDASGYREEGRRNHLPGHHS